LERQKLLSNVFGDSTKCAFYQKYNAYKAISGSFGFYFSPHFRKQPIKNELYLKHSHSVPIKTNNLLPERNIFPQMEHGNQMSLMLFLLFIPVQAASVNIFFLHTEF